MFKFLVRCVFFVAGVVLIADIGLSPRTEQLKVDQHTSQVESSRRGPGVGDTSYTLHLVGGSVATCDVGYDSYTRLKDGDSVEVRATRLWKHCIHISRGDDIIQSNKHWKLFALVMGAVLIAVGVGWLRDDGDGQDGSRPRLG